MGRERLTSGGRLGPVGGDQPDGRLCCPELPALLPRAPVLLPGGQGPDVGLPPEHMVPRHQVRHSLAEHLLEVLLKGLLEGGGLGEVLVKLGKGKVATLESIEPMAWGGNGRTTRPGLPSATGLGHPSWDTASSSSPRR